MKRITLAIAVLTFTATTALAYVQPGQLSQNPQATKGPTYGPGDGSYASPHSGIVKSKTPGFGGNRPMPVGHSPADATNPVPEPATMVLASMGLIALGAAVRRRRH